MSRHALISGASIAGPALALELARRGWRTTIVERAPKLRDEGQNVDVKGAGREVLRRLGLVDAVAAATTGERGLRFVDDEGRVLASFPVSETDIGTVEYEILRGELSRILVDRTSTVTDYRFDTRIEDLEDRGDRVVATLSDGETLSADVVAIAEGLRSSTRDLVLPDARIRELGMYCAYVTLPRTDTDDAWWNWHHALGRRSVHVRPDNLGTTRALLSFMTDVRGLETLDRADQATILRRTFADVGYAAPRILAALDDAPFYFDAIGQARLPRWSAGRAVVVGDAAGCASPISGMSTSIALVGAHVLGGELDRHDDHRTAVGAYESRVRPYVERAQRLTPGAPELGNPDTRLGRAGTLAFFRAMSHPLVSRAAGLLGRPSRPPADEIDLPADDAPTAAVTS
ncbi:FAD-dependent monooxygenase [Actinomycetospora straminea]|uniref:FAD-dependent monooxygenase n=1 Tax=Actinomycetospora straminea TaxID=663607 RepID=A0ABP9EHC2_9PSEU|nr:FAD-dependent monooxygenase [Actinomycetospora straminea]MDD7933805.1 FAD-dependent monooxygenase [Actinomycetospora straminea]